jgi:magnesium chelatase family protein
MQARVQTVAFQGVEVVPVDVQVMIAPGNIAFAIVGLADKAVGESRERVRAAMRALGLALPPQRISVNLSPADLAKEGSHYDLPIALGLLLAMGVLPKEALSGVIALGELALDGGITRVPGILPAALHASSKGQGLICPAACGGEAAWAGDHLELVAAPSLLALINHVRGQQALPRPQTTPADDAGQFADLVDIKGQETAKRCIEIAAAGGHNLLMIGPPGSGKSMLAARLPGVLPPLEADEMLEATMVRSLAGETGDGKLSRRRSFRDPHHSSTLQALVGGGLRARPGEVSLAHHGVLFLDELPEFHRSTLEALRQPIETGRVTVARANAHVTYPARFQLVAAMNPCRCGQTCARGPRCAIDYQARLSGPFLDRIDLCIEVPRVEAADLALPPPAERSADVAARVAAARAVQRERLAAMQAKAAPIEAEPTAGLLSDRAGAWSRPRCNADTDGTLLTAIAEPDAEGRALLVRAAERLGLSARAWHRTLRVARTLADLDGSDSVRRLHIAEALSYRRQEPRAALAGESVSRRKARRRAFLVVLSRRARRSGRAQPPSVELEALTWTELRDALRAGVTTVIIPAAAPNRTVRTWRWASTTSAPACCRIASPRLWAIPWSRRCWPTCRIGAISPPAGHMRFPGTISIPTPRSKARLKRPAAASGRRGSGTSCCWATMAATSRCSGKPPPLEQGMGGSGVRAHFIEDYYRASQTAYVQALRAKGLSDAQIGTHAGAADTSLMLAIDPSLVRTDGSPATARRRHRKAIPPSSAALGQLGVDLIVSQTVMAIRKARAEKH